MADRGSVAWTGSKAPRARHCLRVVPSMMFGALVALGSAPAFGAPRHFSVSDALEVRVISPYVPMAVSPDGAYVAVTVQRSQSVDRVGGARYLASTRTGVPQAVAGSEIWLVDRGRKESQGIPPGENSWGPVWSPNGRYLAFYSDRGGASNIWIWERATGRARAISDAVIGSSVYAHEVSSWTPDSRHIIAKVVRPGHSSEDAAARQSANGAPQAWKADDATVTIYRANASEPASSGVSHGAVPQLDREAGRFQGNLAIINVESGQRDDVVTGKRPRGYWLSPDGRYLAFTSYAGTRANTQQRLFELSVVTLADRTLRLLVPAIEQTWGVSVSWAPDSTRLAYLTDAPPGERSDGRLGRGDCFVVSLDGSPPKNLTSGQHVPFGGRFFAPLWDATGDWLYLTASDANRAVQRTPAGSDSIWKVSSRDATLGRLASIPGRKVLGIVAGATRNRVLQAPGGNAILVLTQEESTRRSGIWQVDVRNGRARVGFEAEVALASQSNATFSTAADANAQGVFYTQQSATAPADIWFAGTGLRDRQQITSLNPDLRDVAFGVTRVIHWIGPDGAPLSAALLMPANHEPGQRPPLIVWPYSGVFRSRDVFRFGVASATADFNFQILAARGYAVLFPDIPLEHGRPMLSVVQAVVPAVDRVVSLGLADERRVGVAGMSFGGYSALALVAQTRRFKAAVGYAGIYNFLSFYGAMDNSGGSAGVGWAETGQGSMGMHPWQARDRYIENSPFFYLDRVEAPVLLLHGDLDHPQLADEVFVGLRRLGKQVAYARYEGEGHGLRNPSNITDAWMRMLAWFDEHLDIRREPDGSVVFDGDRPAGRQGVAPLAPEDLYRFDRRDAGVWD